MAPAPSTRPAIERPKVIINSVTGALDDASCLAERLGIFFRDALAELYDIANHTEQGMVVSTHFAKRLYENWIIFEVVGEKLHELDGVISEICEKAHDERRAVAA